MIKLTEKELNAICEQLEYEKILINKYKHYASMCNEAHVKTMCEQIAAQHKSHYINILNHLKG